MSPQARGFKSLSDRSSMSGRTSHLNIGLYGLEGTGKTTDALFMANHGRVLLVNAEANVHEMALLQRGVDTSNIIPWPDPDEEITFEGLKNVYFELKADLLADPNSWFGVTLDSVTEIIRIFISRSRITEFNRRKGTDKARPTLYKEEWDDFNFAKNQIMEIMRDFRSLPLHMAFTALEGKDKEGFIGPLANPAMMEHLPAFASILIHSVLMDENGDGSELIHAGHTQRHGPSLIYRAKDALGVLPKVIPDPTFTRIWQYTTGELTKDNDDVLIALRERARIRKETKTKTENQTETETETKN